MIIACNVIFNHLIDKTMATKNRVSITISPENMNEINEAMSKLNDVLKPLLVSLTPEQRQEIPKMGDGTSPFVEKVLDYSKSNPEFAPPYMNVPEMEIDLKAVQDLQSTYRPLLQLMQQLDDSIMLSGSEAYVSALAYYNAVKIGARMNVANAKAIFDDLRKRFVKSGSDNATDFTVG